MNPQEKAKRLARAITNDPVLKQLTNAKTDLHQKSRPMYIITLRTKKGEFINNINKYVPTELNGNIKKISQHLDYAIQQRKLEIIKFYENS
jgi:hypothetical protein